MKKFTTSEARKNLSKIVNLVAYRNEIVGLGRHNKTEVIMMKYPEHLNTDLSEITNINAHSDSFAFLDEDDDLYSLNDLKKPYV